jgi:hypothetical protein
MDVFGRFHQLREPGQLVPDLLEGGVGHLQQQGTVALHNQWIVRSERNQGGNPKPLRLEGESSEVNVKTPEEGGAEFSFISLRNS